MGAPFENITSRPRLCDSGGVVTPLVASPALSPHEDGRYCYTHCFSVSGWKLLLSNQWLFMVINKRASEEGGERFPSPVGLVLGFSPTSLKLPPPAALLSIPFIWLPSSRNPDWPLDPSGSMIKYSDQCPSKEKWTFPSHADKYIYQYLSI